MLNADGTHWSTDPDLFAGLPGGQAVIDWFGFVPTFHDAELDRLEITSGAASLALRAFRMTDAADENGFFVLDRHALVTLHLSNVTGAHLCGNATSILAELGIRRVGVAPAGFSTCGGPTTEDIEVSFDTSYGLEGSIYAREVSFSVEPVRKGVEAAGQPIGNPPHATTKKLIPSQWRPS